MRLFDGGHLSLSLSRGRRARRRRRTAFSVEGALRRRGRGRRRRERRAKGRGRKDRLPSKGGRGTGTEREGGRGEGERLQVGRRGDGHISLSPLPSEVCRWHVRPYPPSPLSRARPPTPARCLSSFECRRRCRSSRSEDCGDCALQNIGSELRD